MKKNHGLFIKNKKYLLNSARIVLVLVLGLPIITLIAYQAAFGNRILPGVYLCQYNLGGLTLAQAQKILEAPTRLTELAGKGILLTHEANDWEIAPEKIEFKILLSESVKEAFRIGRKESWFKNLLKRIQIWQVPEKLAFRYRLNQSLLEAEIASISSQIFIPAVDPQLKLIQEKGEKNLTIEPGKNGLEVNQEKLVLQISLNLSCLNFSSLPVPVVYLNPALTETESQKLIQRGKRFLDKNLKISFGNKSWSLNDQDLITFLSPHNGFTEEKINQYLANLKDSIEIDPLSATFQMESGRAVVFQASREGILLDAKKTKQNLQETLFQLENQEEPREAQTEIAAIFIPPKIKTEDVNNLGIKELVGTGRSQFKGSISQRVDNLQLAASKLNGLVIAPGETFSFNKNLGEVSEATGFKKAYIIKEGRTILGDGGGVCQVSTTLFRSVLDAGLPILERHPHAYRVTYYEQDSQPGLDATVYDPGTDLKFENDTPAHLLIQAETDTKNKTLTFKLYGTADGRQTEIGKVYVWDIVPPPPDLYQDDSTLPAGTTKQVDWKAWGAKVRFNWKVTRGEEILQDKTFYSQYRPWQAIFLKGTGNP